MVKVLTLYNTLSQKKEAFKSLEDKKVKMVSCGPSVYRNPHIGNYRTFLFEDILQRYLEYLGYQVTRLMTITDIEDKALAESTNGKLSLEKLTKKNIQTFFREMQLLKIKHPTYTPRSSQIIDQVVKIIKLLVKEGLAYWYNGNVYFDPLKFRNFGKLSRLDMSRWPKKKRRFHKDTYPGVRWNRGDFILWHGYKEDDAVYVDTDIGKGRPAWNIQDAAMILQEIGNPVDIACGGIDNLARHHDYNIALVEGVTKRKLSYYWLHGAHLYVKGKKMSKSKGNVLYPPDLLQKGLKKEHIRFFLIYEHYRKRLNFNFKTITKICHKLDLLKEMIHNLQKTNTSEASEKTKIIVDNLVKSFEREMNDDLNVKAAFNNLFTNVKKLENLRTQGQFSKKNVTTVIHNLQKIDQVLQILF